MGYRIYYSFRAVNEFGQLLKLKQLSLNHKIKVFRAWIRLTTKFFIFYRWFTFKKESVFGRKIDMYNYKDFYSIFSEIFVGNSYFFKASTERPLIIDGGANIGLATIYFKWLYPDSEIHAFEPDEGSFKLLEKNVKQNDLSNVHLHKEALWTKDGRLTFYIADNKPGDAGNSIVSHSTNKKKVTVNSMSLSEFLGSKKIDFLKIDIEGAESEVFRDMFKKNKLKNIKEIIIEFHHHMGDKRTKLGEFLKILEDSGFQYQISGNCYPLYSKGKQNTILIYSYKVESCDDGVETLRVYG